MKGRPSRKKRARGNARRKLQGESIESRVLYSATWIDPQVDADDAGAADSGPAADDDSAEALSQQTDDAGDAALCRLGLDEDVQPPIGGDDDGQPSIGDEDGEPADGDAAVPMGADETIGSPRVAPSEIVFLDAGVPHSEQMIADITANAGADRSIVIVQLDANRDGIEQISAVLGQDGEITAVHIISHGGDGVLSLGNTTLDQNTLAERRDEIAQWSVSLTDDADILIYGCDVASTAAGDDFVADLSQVTGADVAASEDTTGHEDLGGDWDLEDVTGQIETDLVVSDDFQSSWQEVLPTYTQSTDFPNEVNLQLQDSEGQSFRYTSGDGTYYVNEISLALRRADNAKDQIVTVELRESWNGPILGTAQLLSENFDTTLQFVTVSFPTVELTDGTTYVIRVTTTANPGKVYIGYDANGDYAFGHRLERNGSPRFGEDLAFQVGFTNSAPVAFAGPDQTVAEGGPVTLTAAGSSDVDGQPLTYQWTQTGGPAVTLSSTTAVSPTFTAPHLVANTTLTFQVAVSDGTVTNYDTVTITVNADDDAPTANAGPDQTVAETEVVTLTAAGSTDSEGQGLTYTWTQTGGPAVTLSGTTDVSPTFTAPNLVANTTLTFQVAVSDGTSTSFDTVTITVNADDDAPAADAGPDQTVAENEVVTLTGAGSTDPEGQGLIHTWIQIGGPPVTLSSTTAVSPTFTAPNLAANTALTFFVAVSDGTTSSFDTVTITVNADDDAPTADAGPDQTVAETEVVTLTAAGSTDPEGQGLTYQWTQTGGPAVTLSNATDVTPTFTAPEQLASYTLTFQVAVNDGTTTSYDTVTITVNADDDAPAANAGPDQAVAETTVVTLTAAGSTDPEGQGLTYQWTQTGGPAVALSSATDVSPTFTAPNLAANTALTFQVAVSDGTNTSFDTVTITVNADNDAPAASAGPDQTVAETEVVTLTAGGSTDPEGQGLTYQWTQTGGPAVALSNTTAVSPTFTAPNLAANTTLTFQVAVSDGTNTSFDTVTITVNADDDAPTANAGPDQTVAENEVVTLTAAGSTDSEGQGLTYTWTQTGGPAVTLSSATAVSPTFTAPDQEASYTLTFQVAVSDGTTTSYDTVTIAVAAGNLAPVANAGFAVTVNAGEAVTLDGSRSADAELAPLTYQWRQLSGPQLQMSAANTMSPRIMVPGDASGTAIFELEVSDGISSSFATVNVQIRPQAPQPAPAPPTPVGDGTGPAPKDGGQQSSSNQRPTSGGSGQQTGGNADSGDDDADESASKLPPRVDAGTDLTVLGGTRVQLVGIVAGKTDGLRFRWTQISGVPIALENADQLVASFQAPLGLAVDGVVTFQFTATNEHGTTSDTVDVTIRAGGGGLEPILLPPVAAGTQVHIDVPLAGFALGETSVEWLQLAGTPVTLADSSTPSITFEAPKVFVSENLEFEVTTTNGSDVHRQRFQVRIDPVEVIARSDMPLASWTISDETGEVEHTESQSVRGIGRLWAAVAVFLTGWFRRHDTRR